MLEAGPSDRDALARALTAAFSDDPVVEWAIPWPGLRARLMPRVYRELLRQHERENLVWCDEGRTGAALWSPPGRTRMTMRDALRVALSGFHPRLVLRAPMLAYGAHRVEARQPEGEFFYLAVLGVDPQAQGRGVGSRLLAPALELCDRDRIGAYLESSRPENVDFYARHGFRVVGEHRLPRGPALTLMYREPA